MACGGFTCTRTSLAALNVFYMAIAVILISVAACSKAAAIITTVSVMSGIIACGVFLLLIAIVGLVGAIKHHQVLLFFYMIILFLLFVMQFAIACACLALTDNQQQALFKSGWMSASVTVKTKTQEFVGCCGSFDYTIDNVTNADGLGHPSCSKMPKCKDMNATCCTDSMALTVPLNGTNCPYHDCWSTIKPRLRYAVNVVGGLGLFFSFTELMAVYLTVRFRNLKDPRMNPATFL